MTAFAATFVSASLVADTQVEWLADSAIEVLRGIVSTVEFYESKTDDQLVEWARDHQRSIRLLGEQRLWDDAENHRYELDVIDAILDHRVEQIAHAEAVARYTGLAPLTYNPFAGLVAA